ncbi:maestro heat-like repeat-containing protein family member 1 [Tribolium castaneum]|uniref:Maestro heat-like repeat-containing protein family member 1 n=1 Tax=Tribolium castaneum TaxID=7070 RepID=D6WKM3_TRICA|nr:PREDICTED: maestro heat-like repeat-containing protein family member 1 [Tribolium castaneum]EFA03008.2 Maestro heat-like repeat-containing protein family member 1 [Tribolium castaneum]|eukprot:XP_008200435.1 PREDICTED: maestro heat-like repeat-containing protein family member 1 [Tribolium castaneum]
MNGQMKSSPESQLQMAISILLESIADKSQIVIETVNSSIRKLAEKHPNQVLNSCCHFCERTPKPTNEHLSAILSIMEKICIEHIVAIDGDTILLMIDFSLRTMIENQNYEPIVQMPASNVLVALGRKHHIQVMESLLGKLEVGVIPHYMIPHTLGALANANAFGVIPYLKNILAIMLPLLGGVKFDPLKQAFSYALGSFCEALVEYTSNIDQVPDNTITIENFQVEIGMAYDILFSSWLQTREPKVAASVLNALSAIFLVLSVEKVTQHTPRIIHTLLNLYKRQVDAYNITKCLGAIIQKAARVNGTLLEPLLSNILQVLSDLVCVSPDYAQPDLLRNHSEVLRCYECFALHFTDNTVDQLIMQLKNNNEKERIKAILVITHLTSYSTEHAIQRRFKDIVRHLSEMLNDPNIRVKKAMMKIIVAFACKGVLLNKEINPDGPEKYMEFLLKLCCKPANLKNNEIDGGELFDIQKSADNTLCMLSTSVPELESTLWSLLMQCFLGPSYDDAVVVLLRCLTHLASRKTTTEVCEGAFVRCVTLLAMPLPGFRGTFLLNFLKNIRPCDVERYKSVWDLKIPQLVKYLEQNYDNFNHLEWQDLVFDFLSILLESIKDQKFNETLILTARKQLEMYNNNRYMSSGADPSVKQTEKHFLLKCLAMILCHSQEKEIILQTLDDILVNAKLTDYSELNACAEAVGICSRVHLQYVLDKLSLIRKDVLLKKSSKFFSFLKDQKHELGIERIRYVIVSSYAEICNEASTDKLLKVIESEILDFVVNELTNAKDFSIRKVCLRAIGSVGDAMHPNRNSLHIRMLDRDKVLHLVASQVHLHSGPEYIELFPVILPVITSLVRLPLPLESDQRLKLLKLCFDNVYNASAIYCKINSDNDNYYGDLKLVPFVTSSFTKLNQLVQELLMQTLSPATLDEIVTLLEPWLRRRKAEQRLPAVETLRLVLQTYLDNMKFAYDCPTTFGQTGSLLAKIVPRCTDPNKNIRKVATECLCLVLCIASRYEGHMRDHDKQLSNSMQHIQQQIDSDDPKLLYNLTSDLAHIICVNLPHFQLIHLVDGLIDALLDCEASSSNGSSVVLNMTLKSKGSELQGHVNTILDKLIIQLGKIQCARTRSSTLRSILNFATHHSKAVCQILLNQPLPFDGSICDCWAVLSTDQTLVLDLFDNLKKVIKQTALYEEQGNGEIKIATLQPLQAVCAFHELLKNTQLKDICKQHFPEIFAIFLVTLASYIGTSAPAIKFNSDKKEKYGFVLNREAFKLKPAKIALETLKSFLICCAYTQTAGCLTNLINVEANEELSAFLETMSCLVEDVCVENPESLSWLVACLGPYIRAELEPQRVAVVAFFAYLLKQKANHQTVLAENLLEMVLDVQMDSSCLVRKIALQALGFAAEALNTDLVSRHCSPILSVLMNSLDYNSIGNESDVILEGMLSFSKLLTTLEGRKFGTCQVTAAVRIKPLLDQEDVSLRRASFRLLGDLAASLGPEANVEAFKEQVQGNFITLILHLCDPDVNVIKTCKYTLRKVAIYLDSPKVNSMVQEHLIDEANLHYVDFIKDLVKLMAEEMQDLFNLFVMTSLSYLKSPWVPIRSSAALMVGLLFSQLSAENKQRISVDTVCDKLMRLVNDEHEEVRMRAVQAIAYLFID